MARKNPTRVLTSVEEYEAYLRELQDRGDSRGLLELATSLTDSIDKVEYKTHAKLLRGLAAAARSMARSAVLKRAGDDEGSDAQTAAAEKALKHGVPPPGPRRVHRKKGPDGELVKAPKDSFPTAARKPWGDFVSSSMKAQKNPARKKAATRKAPRKNQVSVAAFRVGQTPGIELLSHTLEDMQAAVGGYVEMVPLRGRFRGLHLMCNENGLSLGLPENHYSEEVDWPGVVGDFFVVRYKGGKLTNLTAADIAVLGFANGFPIPGPEGGFKNPDETSALYDTVAAAKHGFRAAAKAGRHVASKAREAREAWSKNPPDPWYVYDPLKNRIDSSHADKSTAKGRVAQLKATGSKAVVVGWDNLHHYVAEIERKNPARKRPGNKGKRIVKKKAVARKKTSQKGTTQKGTTRAQRAAGRERDRRDANFKRATEELRTQAALAEGRPINWFFHWVGGGCNSVTAVTFEDALEAAEDLGRPRHSGQKGLVPDASTLVPDIDLVATTRGYVLHKMKDEHLFTAPGVRGGRLYPNPAKKKAPKKSKTVRGRALTNIRYFEFVGGTSAKYWMCALAGNVFHTRWGRIGSKGKTLVKSYASAEDARSEYDRKVCEKLNKGYKERSLGLGRMNPRGKKNPQTGKGSAAWLACLKATGMNAQLVKAMGVPPESMKDLGTYIQGFDDMADLLDTFHPKAAFPKFKPYNKTEFKKQITAAFKAYFSRKNPKKVKKGIRVSGRSKGGFTGSPPVKGDPGPWHLFVVWHPQDPEAAAIRSFSQEIAQETGGKRGPSFADAMKDAETNGTGVVYVYRDFEAARVAADHIKTGVGQRVVTAVKRAGQNPLDVN